MHPLYVCMLLICLDGPYMFGCPLYVWTPPICLNAPYVWTTPICLDAPKCLHTPTCLDSPVCLDAPCIFGHPLCLDTSHMFGCPHMFGHPLYVWMIFGCPLYIHNTKKVCYQTKGVFICPHTFGCPLYVWIPLHLDTPCMSGHLSYIWMSPYVWMPPVCLDAPCTYTTQRKACYVRLRGCPYAPIHLDAPCMFGRPHMFGCPQYVWMPPVCLDTHCLFGHPHIFGHPPVCFDTPICLDAPYVVCNTAGNTFQPAAIFCPIYCPI